ncbi:hypothetical protein NP233_g7668 [Leucocoprinus birnbaumii]|uniref:Uncharacterized protein n=1 Tax=Leucocoprinus birnbaumii TaxID=56174 RepID=A0AAD5VS49_9AGAR|nr:hypothetical protein NP233_g7668 [Leucocoprinus birnbaumii]
MHSSSLRSQRCVALYLDGPRDAGDYQTRLQIKSSLRRLWPRFVERCEALGIEGPICGVITNLDHLSPGQRRPEDKHSTIRLYDRYNYAIGTFHAPMPRGHEKMAWFSVARSEWREGLEFRRVFKKGMSVAVFAPLK